MTDQEISGLTKGQHVTLPSVMQETKSWLGENAKYDFVDPEIGHMAIGAMEAGVDFSYLHIVSDNLSAKYDEDLSNERKSTIRRKRNNSFSSIISALRTYLNLR